jgi:hypothetical protein
MDRKEGFDMNGVGDFVQLFFSASRAPIFLQRSSNGYFPIVN